jgi:hypothetical protein
MEHAARGTSSGFQAPAEDRTPFDSVRTSLVAIEGHAQAFRRSQTAVFAAAMAVEAEASFRLDTEAQWDTAEDDSSTSFGAKGERDSTVKGPSLPFCRLIKASGACVALISSCNGNKVWPIRGTG